MDGSEGSNTKATCGVVAAVVKVMEETGVIGKNRKAPGLNYAFRGIDDILPVVQPLLVKHGVLTSPEVLEREREILQTSNGKPMISVRLLIRHTFRHVDGSSFVATTLGEAMDSGDKASNKAHTAAFKLALIEVLAIPTHESDRDTEEHSPEIANPKAARPPANKAKPDQKPADDLEKAKGLARARFETSVTEPELEAVWRELVAKMPPVDREELTPPFKARRQAIRANAERAKANGTTGPAAQDDVPF